MKKLGLLLVLLLISITTFSQFCNTASTNMGGITPGTTWTNVAANSGAKRYWTFAATAGCTYDFSSCNSVNTNDTYLRLYRGTVQTTAVLVASNDDNGPFCTGNKASLTWTCNLTGNYSILLTNYVCANISSNSVLSYRVTCAPPYNPCSSITPISNCGTNVSTTMTGGGAGWSVTNCGFATPGQERIFQFTPTTTGNHTINVTSITGGYVDFFWKPVSSGCGNTGWNCIDDINVTGSYNGTTPMTFTAGVSYYILLDPETTGTYNVTFNIGCPIVAPSNDLVCNAITINCGQSIAGTTIGATLTGTGEGGSCGTTQTTGGVWYRVVGTGDVMTASLCVTAWDSKISVFQGTCTSLTCVGGTDDNGPSCMGTSASYSWNSVVGVNYYILVHGYSTTSLFSMSLTCSPPPPPGPCLNPNAWSVDDMPTSTTPTVTTSCSSGFGQFTDEYSQWNNGVAGETYTVMSSIPTDWITVTVSAPNGTVVQYGLSPLDFIATLNDVYYIHVNANGYCLDDVNCRDVSVSKMVALPIELLSFNGKENGSNNLLYWTTASENNNDYFTLERTTNGETWYEVAKIVGAGNSQIPLSYSHMDSQFERGKINYYRLSQTDFDGNKETFNIIAIDNRVEEKKLVKTININGQEVKDTNVSGVYIQIYDDGSIIKVVK